MIDVSRSLYIAAVKHCFAWRHLSLLVPDLCVGWPYFLIVQHVLLWKAEDALAVLPTCPLSVIPDPITQHPAPASSNARLSM